MYIHPTVCMATANQRLHSFLWNQMTTSFFVVGTCLERHLTIDTVLCTVGFTLFFEETLEVKV